jgi:hypothetical protein
MAGLDERTRAGLTVLVAACIPAAAGVAAGLGGNGDGPVFQAGAVLGACAATLMATRRGLWWLVPAQPLVVVPSAVVGMLLAEPSGTKKAKLGADTVTALHHAFVITLVALAAVLVVALVKAAVGRGGEPTAAREARSSHGARSARGAAAAATAPTGSHRTGGHRG